MPPRTQEHPIVIFQGADSRLHITGLTHPSFLLGQDILPPTSWRTQCPSIVCALAVDSMINKSSSVCFWWALVYQIWLQNSRAVYLMTIWFNSNSYSCFHHQTIIYIIVIASLWVCPHAAISSFSSISLDLLGRLLWRAVESDAHVEVVDQRNVEISLFRLWLHDNYNSQSVHFLSTRKTPVSSESRLYDPWRAILFISRIVSCI